MMAGKKRDDIPITEVKRRIEAGEARSAIARDYDMSASSFAHWCRTRGILAAPGNIEHADRAVMPDDLEVRTLAEFPQWIFGADGKVYSSRSDPPREVMGTAKMDRGHARIRLKIGRRQVNLAREMCRAWHGEPLPGEVVLFSDANQANTRPDNLSWGAPYKIVPAEDFVRAWQSSDSVAEVADKLGMDGQGVYSRAESMREHGVPLKKLSAGRPDWDALAALAKSMNGHG